MSVRKEMLERELRKLGFRKADGASAHATSAQQQQQPQGTGHPKADSDNAGGEHSE
jgi:hypothetical protein